MPQIKGTYTVDINDLKKILGKTDDAAASNDATKNLKISDSNSENTTAWVNR